MLLSDIKKKINLELVGLDGNAFSLMGAFSRQAKKEKWTKEEIYLVIAEAMAGDYGHLLYTLDSFCNSSDEEQDDGFDENWEDEEE